MSEFIDGIPGLVPGLDVRHLPLSALEGFVLSRIDGRSGVLDLVALTGLAESQIGTILERLVALGAVAITRRASISQPPARPVPRSDPPPNGERKRATTLFPPTVREYTDLRGARNIADTRAPLTAHSRPPGSPTSLLPTAGSVFPPRDTRTALGALDAPPTHEAPQPPAPDSVLAPASDSVLAPASDSVLAPASDSVLAPAPPVALYDAAELDEEVDLPRERRVQVLERFYRLGVVDHYTLLGVPGDADKKAIKAAYFGLSKSFHPDSMFRKNLGSYKAKMVRVFEALTEAYETLSKNKTRTEYDSYLHASRTAERAERAMALPPLAPIPPTAQQTARAAAAAESQPKAASLPPPAAPSASASAVLAPAEPLAVASSPARVPTEAPAARPPSMSPAAAPELPPRATDDARRLAQEVVARRLRGVMRPAIPTPDQADTRPAPQRPGKDAAPPASASTNPFDAPPKTDARQLLSRLTRTLKDVGQLTGGDDRVVRAVRNSQAAMERGDLSEATQQLARAATLAPDRLELRAEHQRLSQQLAQNLGDTWAQQAEFEMKNNKWASAAITWSKVCEGRPSDPRAHRLAAQSLLKAGGDLRGAQKYAQKAVFLSPNDIEARVLLSQIYLTAGLKLNARRELQAATTLDPANEMVKNLLAELQG